MTSSTEVCPSGREGDAPLTVYYNGACPICGPEVASYRRQADANGVEATWCDISADPDAQRDTGLSKADLERRFHVRTADGALLGGVDAFIVLWRRLPWLKPLAFFVGLPMITPIARLVYDRVLAPALVAFNARLKRRNAETVR